MKKLDAINSSIISYPDYKKFENILIDKSSSIKDFINPVNFFLPTKDKVDSFDQDLFINSMFSMEIVRPPYFNIIDSQIEKFTRFEDYTKTDEVGNIALWLLASLKYLSSGELRLGRELEINQQGNPRDGRLDVVALRDDQALIIETKTDLKSLLNENRFTYQISGYTKECAKYMQEHLHSSNMTILLGIGGEETDMFPPNHKDCTTGAVGGISKIFYDKILINNIKFISANSIWSLVSYKYISKNNVDLFGLLKKIFSREGVVGLLTAGIVINKDGELKIEKIDIKNI